MNRVRLLGIAATAIVVCGLLAQGDPASAATLSLGGTVVDATTQQPIGGACVAAVNKAELVVRTGCTDSTGHFLLTDLPAGGYALRVKKDGYPTTWSSNAPAPYDTVGQFDMAKRRWVTDKSIKVGMHPGVGSITGRVVSQHKPQPDTVVQIAIPDPDYPDSDVFWAFARTDARGVYRFDNLFAASWRLSFVGPKGGFQLYHEHTVTQGHPDELVVTDGSHVTALTETLLPLGSMTFIVRDAVSHDPISGACVQLSTSSGGDSKCAGSTGRIEFGDLLEDTYSVTIYDPTNAHDTAFRTITIDHNRITRTIDLKPLAPSVTHR
jgi:hypothetical protein